MFVGIGLVLLLVLLIVLTWLGSRAVTVPGRVAPFALMSALFLLLGFWFPPFWIFMVLGPILWALLSPVAEKRPRWDRSVAERRAAPEIPPEVQQQALAEALEALDRGRCWACGAKVGREHGDRCHACGTFIGVRHDQALGGESRSEDDGFGSPRDGSPRD